MAGSHDEEIATWRARAQELEAAQWALERRIFQLETLSAIAREAGACHDLPSAARSVLNVLSGTFGALSGAVLLYDTDEAVWSLAAARGVPDDSPLALDGQSLHSWVEAHPQPESPPERLGSALDSLAELLGGVIVSAPILRQGEPAGLILLGETLSGEAFSPEDLALCRAVASTAATLFGDIVSTQRYLRQQQERLKIRGIFEQYCAPDVVEVLLAQYGADLRLGAGEQKIVTIVMADVRGFTGLVQQAAPQEVAEVVNAYYGIMNDVVFAHRGTMDKLMGDAVMAVFGDPISYGDDTLRAVRCAMEMQHHFAELAGHCEHLELPLGLGIGVTTGRALCGNFGSTRRFQYTVMGPPVNLAARLSALTHSGEVFLDLDTHERVSPGVRSAPLPPMWLKGFAQPIPVFRLENGDGHADHQRELRRPGGGADPRIAGPPADS